MNRVLALAFLPAMIFGADQYTRGIGVYPGNPNEDFSPELRVDGTTQRNLALRRAAYHSSSYDYNLTAQLVTDGIKETKLPRWLIVNTSAGEPKKYEREVLFDRNWVTTVELKGKTAWVEVGFGGEDVPEIDRFEMDGSVSAKENDNQEWSVKMSVSDDGKQWREAGVAYGMSHPSGDIKGTISLASPVRARHHRFLFENGRPIDWHLSEFSFFRAGRRVEFAGPHHFTSAWKSAGAGEEWVYVDLGAQAKFDRVGLTWIRRAIAGAVQVSDDAKTWKSVAELPAGPDLVDDVKLASPAQGRYVRVLMTKPASNDGYILSELEVFGTGGMVPVAKPSPAPRPDGRIDIAGGAWRVQRDSLVFADGATLSKPGFQDAGWVIATVPATTLTSYYNAGALPDPNFGDNQVMISDSFFYADFWYRTEFNAPNASPGRRVWLNFGGINWKADIYLNGEKLGRIEGGFRRGQFDITKLVRAGAPNALAVRIEKNATPAIIKEKTFEEPDKNGGALGGDNPTYHATIGWDWIPTIRGRDTGIWSDVFLTTSGAVTIEDPLVQTKLPLPKTDSADMTIEVVLRNHDSQPVTGTLRGTFGDAKFAVPVTLDASSAKTVKLDASNAPALHLANPKLWWPAGYGDAHLYPVELAFEAGDVVSDRTEFQAGVRQLTYSEQGGALRMWINGRRFIPRGGNWGFGESMLRYRAREYAAAVRYHRDLNFTMIRNWVGQIGDDAFYEACDKHGIVVWQDFWLANPWDGPDPDNNAMFLDNAEDMVRRIRKHASVGLYVGRNEGYPPQPIEEGIRALLARTHPDLHYIPSSADDVVSGHGPYRAMPASYYYGDRATPKFHSEMGMPNIMTADSMRATMPESGLWPLGRMYGLHDFCLHGAQQGASFLERIEKSYGRANNFADWVELAQFVNYEGHRAMFEAQSRYRMGLLMWMSHPTWPSLVWQTYDYFFDTNAGYFGTRKASEPLHIQWNPTTNQVEVVNYSAGHAVGLTARVRILNMDGSVKWERSAAVDSPEDSTRTPIKIAYPAGLTPVHFLKLELMRGTRVVSENFYWRGTAEGDYRELRKLATAHVTAATKVVREGASWKLTTELHNTSATPALMVRVKAVRETTRDRILPVLNSDNYVALMPGESRTIVTEVAHADTRGEKPAIVLEGFNVERASNAAKRK